MSMTCQILSAIIRPVNRTILLIVVLIVIGFTSSCGPASSAETASDSSAAYIENKGSDTIVNLALAWAEKYQSEHPDIRISVTGGGSGTGIAALINETVDIANASRQIKQEEIEEAKSNGVDPVEHVIARDAIAVIVNPENPVSQLTLQQISDIYSGKINNWTGSRRRRSSHCAAFARDQFGYACLFSGDGSAMGNRQDKTLVLDGYAFAAFVRRHRCGSAAEPERHRL